MALGCGWAVVARLGIGLVMISLWGIWVLIDKSIKIKTRKTGHGCGVPCLHYLFR